MLISRKKYEEELERQYEKGRYDAFRQVDEEHVKRAKEKEFQELREKVCKLEYDLRHQLERRGEQKPAMNPMIPAVDQGKTCPPDRLDI